MTIFHFSTVSISTRDDRTIAFFDESDEFAACRAAEIWCEARGISVGHAERGSPRGLLWGGFDIQKWRNLNAAERKALDGQMTGDMRNGPVTVRICAKPETPF